MLLQTEKPILIRKLLKNDTHEIPIAETNMDGERLNIIKNLIIPKSRFELRTFLVSAKQYKHLISTNRYKTFYEEVSEPLNSLYLTTCLEHKWIDNVHKPAFLKIQKSLMSDNAVNLVIWIDHQKTDQA